MQTHRLQISHCRSARSRLQKKHISIQKPHTRSIVMTMSNLDPEVLYLILSKVAAQETFYSYQPQGAGRPLGTITPSELGQVYERITGSRVGTRLNWAP